MKTTDRSIVLVTFVIISLFPVSLRAQGLWQYVTPPGTPTARQGVAMTRLADGKVVVYGGEGNQGLVNDVYLFGNDGFHKGEPVNPPPALSGHSMTSIPGSNTAYVFGGRTANGYNNEIYEYDPKIGGFSVVKPEGEKPPGRENHCSYWNNGDLWIFGGRNASGTLQDCWVYSTAQNHWYRDADAPHPIEKSCMFRKGDMIGFYRTGGTHFFDLEHSSW